MIYKWNIDGLKERINESLSKLPDNIDVADYTIIELGKKLNDLLEIMQKVEELEDWKDVKQLKFEVDELRKEYL